MNLIKSVSDRLVAMVLPSLTAGACVPEHGTVCGYKRYQCNGVCK